MAEDFYKILSIEPGATKEEIERAYKEAVEIYDENSMAIYSLVDSNERKHMLDNIKTAYKTLIDDDKRRTYNMRFENIFKGPTKDNETIQTKSAEEEYYDVASFNGDILKKVRTRKDIKLQDISDYTKISKQVLMFIEEDNYGFLPPPVYLRGFLKLYSEYLGLNSKKVIATYMERYDEYKKVGKKHK